ncbi:hypothetical protein [Mycobacterium uberis]|nr:hypothetical protein [Mycobacterium uberis]
MNPQRAIGAGDLGTVAAVLRRGAVVLQVGTALLLMAPTPHAALC